MNKTRIIDPDTRPWKQLVPGVYLRLLYICHKTGRWSAFIRFRPGGLFRPAGVLPRHKHLSASQFYILAGVGEHPQAGEFTVGDYAFEHNAATHTEVYAGEEDVILFMVSHGPTVFIYPDGSPRFLGDAGTIEYLLGGNWWFPGWLKLGLKQACKQVLSRLGWKFPHTKTH